MRATRKLGIRSASEVQAPAWAGDGGARPQSPKTRFEVWVHNLATRDYLPSVDRSLRALRTPLGILVLAALLALLCGIFLHTNGYIVLAGIVAIIVVGLVWPWLCVGGLRGELSFDRTRAHEGESVEVRLRLKNRSIFSAWGLSIDLGMPQATGDTAGMARAAGLRTTEGQWDMRFPLRGAYPPESAYVRSGFPFGLWRAKREIDTPHELLVWPRTFPVGTVPASAGERTFDGTVFHNRPGLGGDFLGVRPYRRGDSLRRIHWGQTARHDRLITCEYQAASLPWVQIVLDVDPAVHRGTGVDSSREWAIRVAASLAQDWLEQGALVELVHGQKCLPAESGKKQCGRILDSLARISANQGQPVLEVLQQPACAGFQGGLQVVVTTDLALTKLAFSRQRDHHQRWVVLRAAGFDQASATLGRGRSSEEGAHEREAAISSPLPFRPWAEITEPELAANQLRRAVRGGGDGC